MTDCQVITSTDQAYNCDKVNSGKYTENVYDEWGQLTKVKAPAFADGHDTKYTYNFTDYDELNRPSKVYTTTASTNSDYR